jgi:Cdc6-like AAA superfamily ATPase
VPATGSGPPGAIESAVVALGVVGREAELTQVEGFLGSSAQGFAALVLAGEAGIGKTTVWQEALRRARERGAQVLRCRPAAAEAKLSFAALADLLVAVDEAAFEALPGPQRDALAVALSRTSSTTGAPIARAVAVGFLKPHHGQTCQRGRDHPVVSRGLCMKQRHPGVLSPVAQVANAVLPACRYVSTLDGGHVSCATRPSRVIQPSRARGERRTASCSAPRTAMAADTMIAALNPLPYADGAA